MDDFEKEILSILYANKGERPLNSTMIHRKLEVLTAPHKVESALRNLIGLKLVRAIKKPGFRAPSGSKLRSYPASNDYEIDIKGVICFDNNFEIEEERKFVPPVQQTFMNNQIIFGDYAKIENNFYEILNTTNNITHEEKTEITNVFQTIEQEMKQETVNKGKIKSLLKTLADKGTSKLFEAALGAIIKEFVH